MDVDDGSREDTYGVSAGSNQTVVVLFPGAMGDIVLVLPTLRRLRAVHAGARLVVAVDRRLAPLIGATGLADRVAVVDGPEIARTLGGGPAPEWWRRAGYLYSWLGGRDPDGRRALARHADRAAFSHVVRGDGPMHAALEYAAAVGWRPSWEALAAGATIPVVPPGGVGARGVERGTLVVHRGAGAVARRWRPDGFARVAGWWRARAGPVVDLRGPADQDLVPLPGAVVVTPAVAELPALLAAATAFVGNDSGPAHVAGAVGVRGVVLFGPTRAPRWRPPSPRIAVAEAEPDPGGAFGRLDADAVLDALERATARS
jgi:heptosyltransferase-3